MITNTSSDYARLKRLQYSSLSTAGSTTPDPTEIIASGLQPYDDNLYAIASLTGTSGVLKKTGVGTWVLDTNTYLTAVTSAEITSALGYTPVTNARTLTINGVTYDLTQDRSWTIAGGVTSFNTRTGAITLLSSDITSTLGYTPYSAANPAGYISSFTETDPTVGSHIKAITTTNISNWNTAYGWGNHASAGYLTGITSGQVTTALGFTPENVANKGVANGYASLDGSGLVPSTQLPSYVDDVLEYTNLAAFPGTGTTGKIYVALDTNKIYRWSGSAYIEVSPTVGTIWGGITGTLANQTDLQSALDSKVPTTRTLTINGTTYDLSANRSWTINSMVYPSAGIAVSTGTAWGTSITDNSANWNTAYSWGNHAVAGYLLSSTASSTYLTISNAASTYLTISNAASSYQPLDGDLTAIAGLAGTSGFLKKTAANTWSLDTNTYLTSYTETDPIYVASSWYTTTNNSANWNTAFGWGDHASAGYLTSATAATTYVPQTRTLTINGTTYDLSANRSWTVSGGSSALSGLTDVTITSVANGQLLQYSSASSKWVNWTPNYLTSYTETDTLASVTGRGNSTTSSITVAGLTVNTNPFNLNTYIKGAAAGFIINDNADTANNFGVTDSGNVRVYRGSLTIGSVVGTGTGILYAGSIIKSGGTSAQFLKADGSVDSTAYYAASNPSGYTTNTGTVTSVSGTGTVSGLTLTGTVTSSGSLTLGGTLSLTSGQVTTALGYTPYNSTNPNGYTTNTGTVTSVAGTGTVSGLTLTGTVTTSGSLTLGGTLSLTSGQVTTALGYTPYNSTNPSGYITSSGSISGNAATTSQRDFSGDISTSGMGRFTGWYSGNAATGLAAEVGISAGNAYLIAYNRQTGTYAAVNIESTSSNLRVSGSTVNVVTGSLQQGGNQVLHAGNYTSYSPSLTGSGASGTWGISITGSAASITGTYGGTLTSSQVTTALGYTPYNSTNPNGYTSNTGTVTSVSGTGSYGGLTLSGTVTTSGSLTLGGTPSGTWPISVSGNAATASTSSLVTVNSGNTSADWYPILWHSGNGVYSSSGVQIYAAGNYIRSQYINTTDNDETGITRFVIKNGDNYHRSATTTAAADIIRGVASGTWSISITGNAATATTATTASSVAWTNVSGRPTAVSSFTNDSGYVTSSGTVTYATYLNPLSGDSNYKLAYTANGVRTNAGEWGRAVMYYIPNGQTYGIRVDRADYSDSTGSVAWTNVSGRPTALSSFTNDSGYITSGGRAYPRRSDGGDLNFYWSGQGGQPPWLWGGSDGTNMYVYNPSNFSVNYASSAGQVTINYNNDSNSTYQMLWGSGNSVYGTGGIYCNPASDTLYATLFIENSSIRFKENVIGLTGALDKVVQMRGVQYNKIGTSYNQVGVIAEEMESVLPQVVNYAPDGQIEGVAYARLTAVLIEAVKEQQKQIEELKELLNQK